MTEQATWVPIPRRRSPKIKISDAMARVDKLANWYEANKPEVTRIAVTADDYKSFEESAGKGEVYLTDGVIRYRNFVIVKAP